MTVICSANNINQKSFCDQIFAMSIAFVIYNRLERLKMWLNIRKQKCAIENNVITAKK